MRRILTFFLFVILTFASHSQTASLSGIKFNSKNVERLQRTSVWLNDGSPIKLSKPFSFSFDISFWDPVSYGTVVGIETEDKKEIKLIYSYNIDDDNSVINLIHTGSPNNLIIKFPTLSLSQKKWFTIKLIFDVGNNLIKVYLNNDKQGTISFNFKDEGYYSFVFGIKNFDNTQDFDVPAMFIKNILLSEDNERKYFWSLNPFTSLRDEINDAGLRIKNAGWVYEDHQVWKKLTEFRVFEKFGQYLGVTFDSLKSRLYIDGADSLIIYDLNTRTYSSVQYQTKSPAYWSDLLYDERNLSLYSFFTAMGKVSVYDISKNEWLTKEKKDSNLGNYFGSSKFLNLQDGNLYLLGGYGLNNAKNSLFKYNFQSKQWVEVDLKKNEMSPRAFFTFGEGFNKGEYLVYGGIGNETGVQDYGFNNYYNLYKLSLNDSQLTKVELPEQNKFAYALLMNDFYLDRADSAIYFLSVVEKDSSFPLVMNKLDVKNGDVSVVGNEFWKRQGLKWIYSDLYYNKSTGELISVVFDSTNVEIFAINHPPVSTEFRVKIDNKSFADNTSVIIIFTAISGIIIFSLYLVKKRFIKFKSRSLETSVPHNENNYVGLRNHIKLFGGFRIFNSEGKNIIQEFSPRIKEILLLILLRSFNYDQSRGITSEELSAIIWPDASPASSKSNRGVAINNIRNILGRYQGIKLLFEDKTWQIRINEMNFKCDYDEYQKLKNVVKQQRDFDKNEIFEILELIGEGEFLAGISFSWLDAIKVSINQSVIETLFELTELRLIKDDNQLLLKVTDTILKIDPVEENAMKLKLKILVEEGKHSQAKTNYELFISEYKRLYDEEYSESFQQLISE